VPDDRDPKPLARAPLVRQDRRDFEPPKTATPPGGYPIPPRQDDQAIVAPVPQDFAIGAAPITNVGLPADVELAARVRRTQHATESVAATSITINSRLTAVELDVKAVKSSLTAQDKELATIKTGVETTNRLIGSVVDVAKSKITVEHDVLRAQVELGTAQQVDKLDQGKQLRERETVRYTTRQKVVGALVAAILGALGWIAHALIAGAH
jgi:hypothetical protein